MKTPIRTLSATGIKPSGKVKGIWLWTADFIAARPDDVINKLSQGHFTELYVPYNTAKASIAQYQYFIGKATDLGIEVHALDGDPTWCRTTGQTAALDFIDRIKAYNDQVYVNQRFKQVHIDAEPNGLNGTNGYPNYWNTDKPGTLQQWIDNSDVWIARAHSYGLKIGGAFPSWLDGETPPTSYAPKNVAQVMIDKYDYYGIMAYNDDKKQVVSISDLEVRYAASPKCVVAIETIAVTPTYITFQEEGFAAADQALIYVDNNFQSIVGYKGIAVHDFEQWEKFMAPYMKKNPSRTKTPARVNNAR